MSTPRTACPQCGLEYSRGEIFCAVDGTRLMALNSSSEHGLDGSDPLIGQTLAGRYRIVRKVGEGGMGIVYEAVHVIIEKRVALKVLREDFSHRDDVVERFRQEAKSASRIGHEHIIDISDFGVTPAGAHFFVMEFLQGNDLAEELERRGPLPTARAVGIALQCAKALGAAHAKGIVHRDMKPENIFLLARDTGEDFVKIVDFGIAKMSETADGDIAHGPGGSGRRLTKTGMIFGTPEYMSPEHAAGKALDHRVDVYALGIILYELLTGRVPFMGDTFMGILTAHMFEPLPSLQTANPHCSAPPELERLIERAVSKNPDDRPQSMDELAQALIHVRDFALAQGSPSLPPPGTLTHLEPQQAPFAAPFSAPFSASQPRPPPEFAHSVPSPFIDESYTPQATRTTRPSRWRYAPWLAFIVGAALAALLWPRDALQPPISSRGMAPVVAPPLPELAPEQAQEPAPEAEPPAREVTVEVQSDPAGAAVSVEGKRACDATPCRFQADRGVLVAIRLEKAGYKPGTTELTPEHDYNQVSLVLAKKRERRRNGNRMEGDLMLPDAFGTR